jgi:hypothetical protein
VGFDKDVVILGSRSKIKQQRARAEELRAEGHNCIVFLDDVEKRGFRKELDIGEALDVFLDVPLPKPRIEVTWDGISDGVYGDLCVLRYCGYHPHFFDLPPNLAALAEEGNLCAKLILELMEVGK